MRKVQSKNRWFVQGRFLLLQTYKLLKRMMGTQKMNYVMMSYVKKIFPKTMFPKTCLMITHQTKNPMRHGLMMNMD